MGARFEQAFITAKEEIQMASEHTKICSASFLLGNYKFKPE